MADFNNEQRKHLATTCRLVGLGALTPFVFNMLANHYKNKATSDSSPTGEIVDYMALLSNDSTGLSMVGLIVFAVILECVAVKLLEKVKE